MVLDREEEAKRLMNGGGYGNQGYPAHEQNYGGYGGQGQGLGYDNNPNTFQPQMPNMNDIV